LPVSRGITVFRSTDITYLDLPNSSLMCWFFFITPATSYTQATVLLFFKYILFIYIIFNR